MKKILIMLLALLLSMPLAFATITIRAPTYDEGANRTQTYIEFNISSTDYINSSLANLEWANETGTRLNLTPTQVVNFTLNAACASNNCNYSFWNVSGLLDGQHTFKGYIRENESGTLRVSAARNVTQDDTAPESNITEPANGSSQRSSGQINLVININDNAIGFRNGACIYELNGVNRTFTCGNSTFVISPQGGTNTLQLYTNDSNNNRSDPEITFLFTLDTPGGGGGGGIALPPAISDITVSRIPPRPAREKTFIDSIAGFFNSLRVQPQSVTPSFTGVREPSVFDRIVAFFRGQPAQPSRNVFVPSITPVVAYPCSGPPRRCFIGTITCMNSEWICKVV